MFKTFIALLATLSWPAAVPAQDAKRPDPLDARAATAPLVHRSALAGYKKWAAESPAVAWRDANDAVLGIGVWRAYAREASAADAPASAPVRKP